MHGTWFCGFVVLSWAACCFCKLQGMGNRSTSPQIRPAPPIMPLLGVVGRGIRRRDDQGRKQWGGDRGKNREERGKKGKERKRKGRDCYQQFVILVPVLDIGLTSCQSNPCQNGGTCEHFVNSFICHCPDGYIDQVCSRGIILLLGLYQCHQLSYFY